MISTLENFDKVTAAGILARAALAIEDQDNPAGTPKLPDETSLRRSLLAEARKMLGVLSSDQSPRTLERLGEILDTECESLIGPTNIDSNLALKRLSERGELPSDLFEIRIIPNIEKFHGRKYPHEKKLIESTIRSPDQEQHFGPPASADGPFLISLFAKHIPHQYPLKSFTMLVAGQRNELVLDIHQAWRIYPDIVNLNGIANLVDMLRRFADIFGTEISLGDKRGHFILAADIPKGQVIKTTFNIKADVDTSRKKSEKLITVTCFVQHNPMGGLNQAALATGISLSQYAEVLKSRGW